MHRPIEEILLKKGITDRNFVENRSNKFQIEISHFAIAYALLQQI